MDYQNALDQLSLKSYTLSQFDTNEDLAIEIIENIVKPVLRMYGKTLNDVICIEPAAGTGSFFNNLGPYTIGVDIDKSLLKYNKYMYIYDNFLNIEGYEHLLKLLPDCNFHIIDKINNDYRLRNNLRNNTIVVTNPPFSIGNRGKRTKDLATQFINKSSEMADLIFMILPHSFCDKKKHKNINKELHLLYSESLPRKKLFIRRDIKEGFINQKETKWARKNWVIGTVFQIWGRKYDEFGNVILREEINYQCVPFKKDKNGYWRYINPLTNKEENGDFVILSPTDMNANLIIKKWASPNVLGDFTCDKDFIIDEIVKNINLENDRNNDVNYEKYKNSSGIYKLDRSHSTFYFLYAYDINNVMIVFDKMKKLIVKWATDNLIALKCKTLSQNDLINFYLKAKYNI